LSELPQNLNEDLKKRLLDLKKSIEDLRKRIGDAATAIEEARKKVSGGR